MFLHDFFVSGKAGSCVAAPPSPRRPPVSRLFPTGAGDDGVLLLQAAATAVHDAGGMTGGGPAPDRRAQCRSLAPRCCVWFGAHFPLKPRQSYGLLSHWFKADSFRSIIWGPFVSLAPPPAEKRQRYMQSIDKMKAILEQDRKALKYGGAAPGWTVDGGRETQGNA